jgi:hypothetical protein
MISERTRTALQAARAGKRLGNPRIADAAAMERAARDTADSVVEDQITVHGTPEQLFDAVRVAAKKRRGLKISDPRGPEEVAKGLS